MTEFDTLKKELTEAHEKISLLSKQVTILQESQVSSMQAIVSKITESAKDIGGFHEDKNAKIIHVSGEIAKRLGYTNDEIIGMNFVDILADGIKDYSFFYPIILFDIRPKEVIYMMRCKSGEVIYAVMIKYPSLKSDGSFSHTVDIVLDVFSSFWESNIPVFRNVLSCRAILDMSNDCVAYYNNSGELTWVNEEYIMLTKSEEKELLNKHYSKIQFIIEKDTIIKILDSTFKSNNQVVKEVSINDNTFSLFACPIYDEKGILNGVLHAICTSFKEKDNMGEHLIQTGLYGRKRISEDLHDGIGQTLTGISFLASALKKETKGCSKKTSDIITEIIKYTQKARNMIRGVINGLCPVGDDPEGLMVAISTLVADTKRIFNISIRFNYLQSILVTNFSVSNHLYFIVLEAVNNALKHSGCSQIDVNLEIENNIVLLMIRDDGNGIISHTGEYLGCGLSVMKHRASIIGASISISKAREGTGTLIKLEMPKVTLTTD